MRAVDSVAAVPLRHRDVLVVQVATQTQVVPILPVDGARVVECVVVVDVIHVEALSHPHTNPTSEEALRGGLRHSPSPSATVQTPATTAVYRRGPSSPYAWHSEVGVPVGGGVARIYIVESRRCSGGGGGGVDGVAIVVKWRWRWRVVVSGVVLDVTSTGVVVGVVLQVGGVSGDEDGDGEGDGGES